MRTSTHISPRLGRLAGAAAILFVPLGALLVVLLARVDDLSGGTAAGLATLGVSGDATAALRWVIAAALMAAASVVAATLTRRR
jgi:hypothetical protein